MVKCDMTKTVITNISYLEYFYTSFLNNFSRSISNKKPGRIFGMLFTNSKPALANHSSTSLKVCLDSWGFLYWSRNQACLFSKFSDLEWRGFAFGIYLYKLILKRKFKNLKTFMYWFWFWTCFSRRQQLGF